MNRLALAIAALARVRHRRRGADVTGRAAPPGAQGAGHGQRRPRPHRRSRRERRHHRQGADLPRARSRHDRHGAGRSRGRSGARARADRSRHRRPDRSDGDARGAASIPAKAIEDEVARALSEQYQLGAAKDITVNFDRMLRAMYVAPSAIGEPRVARITYDARSGRFDADVDVPTSAASHGTLRLGGRAMATVEVVVMAHAVERGTRAEGFRRRDRAPAAR